jgi:hypothetical protein
LSGVAGILYLDADREYGRPRLPEQSRRFVTDIVHPMGRARQHDELIARLKAEFLAPDFGGQDAAQMI